MSTLLRLSTPRLEKAIKRNVRVVRHNVNNEVVFSVWELREALTRRGMSDRNMHHLFFRIIGALEPPGCHMAHCQFFGGAGAPMNCAAEKIPGRCSIYRKYKQRKAARDAKTTLPPPETIP